MRGTRMSRAVRLLVAVGAAAALVTMAPAEAAPKKHVYSAPFKVGTSGGDQFSYHSATGGGGVTLAGVYPNPRGLNCSKATPYPKLPVEFRTTHPVRKALTQYDSTI